MTLTCLDFVTCRESLPLYNPLEPLNTLFVTFAFAFSILDMFWAFFLSIFSGKKLMKELES
jgi:hypothetical protein